MVLRADKEAETPLFPLLGVSQPLQPKQTQYKTDLPETHVDAMIVTLVHVSHYEYCLVDSVGGLWFFGPWPLCLYLLKF